MRPCVSVAGTRCTRWTPLSNLSRAKTPRPEISATISLNPPAVPSLDDRTSTFQRLPLGVFGVHAEQIAGEQSRFVAARARPDFEDGAALVGGVLGQERDLNRLGHGLRFGLGGGKLVARPWRACPDRDPAPAASPRGRRAPFPWPWKAWIAATTGSSSLSSRDNAEYCAPGRALGEASGDFLVAAEDEIEIVVGGHWVSSRSGSGEVEGRSRR